MAALGFRGVTFLRIATNGLIANGETLDQWFSTFVIAEPQICYYNLREPYPLSIHR